MLNDIVKMGNPLLVFEEVKLIVSEMFPQFDFDSLDDFFKDTVRLFEGNYPGFQTCDTEYHDLKHTTDTLLAIARLIHGATLRGLHFSKRGVFLALTSAMLHDSGYILALDESGQGAKYTLTHVERSIDFLKRYFFENDYSDKDANLCDAILKCTGLDEKILQIEFLSWENEILGKMLGTADLLGQMGDRNYLEKLPFLYREFSQGKIEGIGTELDFLDSTPGFYKTTLERLAHDLGGVNVYMRYHFRARWDIDEDLYISSIENSIRYLEYVLKNYREDVHAHLKRGGMMRKFRKRYPELTKNRTQSKRSQTQVM